MSKKDNADETPIEFYIPGPGKRPKIPIPINQPNWVYQKSAAMKPTALEWMFIGIELLFIIALVFLLIASSMYKSALWGVVFILVVIAALHIRSALIRVAAPPKEEDEVSNFKKDEKKKIPKRRKDYR